MKLLRLAAFAAALSLAACTSSPTGTATTDPADPSFDGTHLIGSGSYTDQGPGLAGSGNEGQGIASDTTSTGPGRGGASLGSGN